MKLKDKLKTLFFKNDKIYRYNIQVSEKDFVILQKYSIYNIEKTDNWINFSCDSKAFNKIKKEKIEIKYQDNFKKTILFNKHRFIITFILLLITIILFCINQFFIREIAFSNKKYQNEKIYEKVKSYTLKIGPYLVLKDSISDISKELRQEFYEYAYVGLSKKGAKLLIDISYQDLPNTAINIDNKIGEYYSTSDATISYINITSGKVLVNYNDVVKAGDLLVTSNLQHENSLYNKELMVPLKGFIIGTVKEYFEIDVLKKEEIEIFTGCVEQFYEISYKNKILWNKENNFLKSFKTKKNILNILNIYINKVTFYEKKMTTISRTKEEACMFANTLLYQNYEKNFISDKEKIVSTNVIKEEEYNDYFHFKFFVVVKKSIVLFKKI